MDPHNDWHVFLFSTGVGISQWSQWSLCLTIEKLGCQSLRQRVCLDEDLSKCPTTDQHGVEDQFKSCKDDACEGDNTLFNHSSIQWYSF